MKRTPKPKPYRARMWAIKGDDIGLIAGTLAYTRAAAYQFIAGKEAWSPATCQQNGYRAVGIKVSELPRKRTRRTKP